MKLPNADKLVIERDTIQRGIRSPSHLLRTATIREGRVSFPILEFRDPRRACRSLTGHWSTLVHAQHRAPGDTSAVRTPFGTCANRGAF